MVESSEGVSGRWRGEYGHMFGGWDPDHEAHPVPEALPV